MSETPEPGLTPEEEERIVREHEERMEREQASRSKFGWYVLIAAALFSLLFIVLFLTIIRRFTD